MAGNATRHAFRWQSNGGFTDIGVLGNGNFATGLGINDAGFVCGYGNTTANGSTYSGFFWTPALGKVAIGSLYPNGDYDTRAFGVNMHSQVVGWSWLNQNGLSHAFVWTLQDGMDDLNNLIPANSGWVLTRAAAINDNGEIVGTGTFNGKARAFKLVPATCTISGRVTFGEFGGDKTAQALQIEVRNPGSVNPLETHTVFTDAAGQYSFDTAMKGNYDIAMKGPHWLRKAAHNINTLPQSTIVSFTLINGDCDNDNEVSIGDFSMISAAFNASPGDANWLPGADLNGDLGVDIGDYSIMSAHFNQLGDQ
jgi:probable HAF family extracellular repeat protein